MKIIMKFWKGHKYGQQRPTELCRWRIILLLKAWICMKEGRLWGEHRASHPTRAGRRSVRWETAAGQCSRHTVQQARANAAGKWNGPRTPVPRTSRVGKVLSLLTFHGSTPVALNSAYPSSLKIDYRSFKNLFSRSWFSEFVAEPEYLSSDILIKLEVSWKKARRPWL